MGFCRQLRLRNPLHREFVHSFIYAAADAKLPVTTFCTKAFNECEQPPSGYSSTNSAGLSAADPGAHDGARTRAPSHGAACTFASRLWISTGSWGRGGNGGEDKCGGG